MTKSKMKETIMVNPQAPEDIFDLEKLLQQKEICVLVNMSKVKGANKDLISACIDCILSGSRSYMKINVKKVFPKVFVCYSERQKV